VPVLCFVASCALVISHLLSIPACT